MSGRDGIPGPRNAIAPRLDDRKADEVARDHRDRLDTLAKLPAAALKVIPAVLLADGASVHIAHGYGRPVVAVLCSPVRGATTAGFIEELRPLGLDRSKFVMLRANGFGGTVTVDVAVL